MIAGVVDQLGKRNHTPPCSSAELFFADKMGSTEERFRWWIWVFLAFIGLLYPPPAWNVLQKIFSWWWLCTLFLLWSGFWGDSGGTLSPRETHQVIFLASGVHRVRPQVRTTSSVSLLKDEVLTISLVESVGYGVVFYPC